MRGDVVSTVLFPADLPPYQDALIEQEGHGLLKGGLLKVAMTKAIVPAPHILRGMSTSLRAPAVERFFAETLAASEATIVQFNHLGHFGSLALPLVARAMGARVVIALHDFFLLCADWNLMHKSGVACGEARSAAESFRCVECLHDRIESIAGIAALHVPDLIAERAGLARAVLEQADALVAPSAFVRDQFARAWGAGIADKIRIVPHGTASDPFPVAYRPQAALRVAYVGYVGAEKGSQTFLEAAEVLQGTAIRFRLLGSGAKIGARANVEMMGAYLQRELPRHLQDVDVVYIGSMLAETYCYTVDEAFRAGVPVIASAVGAIPERVSDGTTGLLIPPGDVPALVAAVERLDRDRALLSAMRENVRRMRLTSIEENAAAYVALYRELAERPYETPGFDAPIIGDGSPPLTLEAYVATQGFDVALPLTPVSAAHRR